MVSLKIMKIFVLCALVSAACLSTTTVLGQTAADKATAQALFDEGKKLLEEGKYLPAAEKFQASQRLDAGIGTLLYTANAFEKAGKLASAWANFREAQATARSRRDDRMQVAKERADKLQPRLSKLKIEVGNNVHLEGFRVKRDGLDLSDALWNTPSPMDKGSYQISASAPGHERWVKEVSVTQEGVTTSIRIPLLEQSSTEAATTTPASETEPVATVPSPADAPGDEETAGPSTSYTVAASTLTALGAVGVGVGIVFAVDASSKNDEASSNCGETTCSTQAASDLTADALTSSHVATASFAVGGAALASGLLMWILMPSDDSGESAYQIRALPTITHNRVGLWLGGGW